MSKPRPPLPLPAVTGPPPGDCCRLPWRSATLGWLVALAAVGVGLPLFLRMPIWIDATLYDLAARAVLAGGVHYRDVFDTNPPGFVWALCLVRTLFGTSMEAVRAVDFAVVTGIVALLLRWARAAGATAGGAAWTAAGAAVFYLFVSEFNHCQRDVWMMLPAVAAAWYRVRRVQDFQARYEPNSWVFRSAVLEGALWGLAVWIKPHVILIAAAAWLVTQPRVAGSADGRWTAKPARSVVDLAGSLAGGLLVGGAGLGWLVWSGTWPHMLDVFTNWNPSYLQTVFESYETKKVMQLAYFPPWSLLLVFAVPLAVLNLLDARLWAGRDTSALGPLGWAMPGLYDRRADADARFVRAVLAAVYLAWVAVTFFLQKQFHYAHVPETLLMLALFAANRWAVVVPVTLFQLGMIAWVTLNGPPPVPAEKEWARLYQRVVWAPPNREPNRFAWWPRCFGADPTGELRDAVSFQADTHAGVEWKELDEVAAFLRTQGVRPGDDTVMCWHDSPHALYLAMNLRPPIRFMHLSTAMDMGPRPYEWVKAETTAAAPKVRFVVSDLRRVALFYPAEAQARMSEPGPGPTDLLPPVVPRGARTVFPLNQPTAFRSAGGRGRYVVHRLVNPVGEIFVPGWVESQ